MHALLRISQRVYNEITHAIEFCPIQDWEYHMGVRIRTHAVNISMSKYKNILMTHPVFSLLPVYKHNDFQSDCQHACMQINNFSITAEVIN